MPPFGGRAASIQSSRGEQDSPRPTSRGRALQEWEELHAHEVFEAYDYDKSGMIDMFELKELLMEQRWCMDSRGVDAFIRKFLGPDTKFVAFDEFFRLFRDMLALQPAGVRKQRAGGRHINVADLRELEAESRRLFQAMDSRGEGYLDEEEMRQVIRESGLPDLDGDNYESVLMEHMELADRNQDGRVSFEEFVLYRNVVLDRFLEEEALEAQAAANGSVDPNSVVETVDPWEERHFIE